MTAKNFNVVLRDIDSVKPYENNPRVNDGGVDAVKYEKQDRKKLCKDATVSR